MRTYAGGVPVVEVVRSGFVESRHHGSVAILGPSGEVVVGLGDVDAPIFPRSANKPMQAVGLLRAGLKLDDEADLALVSASHSGEPMHVDRVEALLASAGLDESDLGCPPDLPLSEAARAAVLRSGAGPARRFMNCSGKHTGMLLTCVGAGWPTKSYLDPDHPVQRACRSAVEDLIADSVPAVGVDGCGAPVFALSLTRLAAAFLGAVTAPVGSEARRVADAMRTYPELVSGTGADDARLMRGVPGLLSKGGAEGVVAVAVPGVGAVALKIDDGAQRARMPVLVAALRSLGVSGAALDELAQPVVLGGGHPVGHLRSLRLP